MATEVYHDYLKNGASDEPAEQPQPESETIVPAEPITPVALETNLVPFLSPKQPETQPVAQPQDKSSYDFYLQSYQAWVNKLVAQGDYAKIKSFDEWYAIAIEVM